MTKEKKILILNAFVVGILILGGCALIWTSVGWKPAVGVFLIIWGHNIEMHKKKSDETQPFLDLISKIRRKDKE